MRDHRAVALEISRFATEHGLKIHPGQDAESFASLVIRKGGCPCVPGRNHCPCQESLDDIKDLGRCRCGLFCNDGYIEEYNNLNARRKSRKTWTRKPKVSF